MPQCTIVHNMGGYESLTQPSRRGRSTDERREPNWQGLPDYRSQREGFVVAASSQLVQLIQTHPEARFAVAHYIAIIEEAGPDHAVGVWFPDLPGCTSGGDDIDEALRNAPEALELYAEGLHEDGKRL